MPAGRLAEVGVRTCFLLGVGVLAAGVRACFPLGVGLVGGVPAVLGAAVVLPLERFWARGLGFNCSVGGAAAAAAEDDSPAAAASLLYASCSRREDHQNH